MRNNTNSQGKPAQNSLNSISAVLNSASQTLSNYVISPLQNLGIAGFLFDKDVNSSVTLSVDYTKNYVEKGSYVTDHGTQQPKMIVITGYVGEKVYKPSENGGIASKILPKLTTINALVPVFTKGMQQLQDTLTSAKNREAQDVINNGVDFWNTLKALNPPRTRTEQAYNYFQALLTTQTILSITLPTGQYHPNMLLTRVSPTTRENTKDIVDFTIELQEWRVADTLYAPFDENTFYGRTKEAKATTATLGRGQGVQTKETPKSLLRDGIETGKKFFQ
jgi:hypothetical protein